jgi:hypothetical protein
MSRKMGSGIQLEPRRRRRGWADRDGSMRACMYARMAMGISIPCQALAPTFASRTCGRNGAPPSGKGIIIAMGAPPIICGPSKEEGNARLTSTYACPGPRPVMIGIRSLRTTIIFSLVVEASLEYGGFLLPPSHSFFLFFSSFPLYLLLLPLCLKWTSR